uniref:Uncharacterized protein n=1 Tax=Tanacetum cinerariifolium TaxID=118510 RepID=A0A6L2JNL5_TANCI|nr:hypothetical protein [Tanacetum cinerariifolium]
MDTKFVKPSILGKLVLQPPRNQFLRQLNAFKSERPHFSIPRFASQVDMNNVLSKPVTPHYLPKVRESAPVKPHHVNAPSSYKNSKKEAYGSNDMAHNYYLEEHKKKTQDKNMNLKPKEMHSAKTHHILMLVHKNLRAIIKHLGIGFHLRVVMSTPAYVDSKTITQADGAQSSRVPVPLLDDPYVAVRVPLMIEELRLLSRQQAVLVVDTAASEPLGLGYGAARRRALESTEEIAPSTYEVDPEDGRVYTDILTYVPHVAPVQTLPSPEWSLGSLPVSPSSQVVPSAIASLMATSVATISVDEDQFLEGYDRDLRELYTRSGAVRDEIFSLMYRFRSLELEDERATMTFSAIWRENHDLRRQLAVERRERLELTDCVARMEKRQECGGE